MRLGFIWFFGLLFIEIWSIIKMSEYVGGWATFILLVAGFIFGLQLMRSQGISALAKASQNLQSAESPLAALAQGVVKAFAGILLIIPGFFSDIFAFIILLPFVSNGFARHLAKKGQFQGFAAGNFSQGGLGGAFRAGGFGGFGGAGARSANDDFAAGNVYDHEGSAKVDESSTGKHLEGQVIAMKPKDKDK